jgi:hypothetical protein
MASTVPTRNSQNEPATARSTRPAAIASSAPASTCASRKRADSGRAGEAEGGEAEHRHRRDQPGQPAGDAQAVLDLLQHRADAVDRRPQVEPGEDDRHADEQQALPARPVEGTGRRCGSPGGWSSIAGGRRGGWLAGTTFIGCAAADPDGRGSARPRHPAARAPAAGQGGGRRDEDAGQVDAQLGGGLANSARRRGPATTPSHRPAGTVVTEMKTPTSAPLLAEVRESTPAIPARTATSSDQRSGG